MIQINELHTTVTLLGHKCPDCRGLLKPVWLRREYKRDNDLFYLGYACSDDECTFKLTEDLGHDGR